MKSCNVKITTSVDGRETDFVGQGEMQLYARSADLRYQDGQAFVRLTVCDETATVERQGDYSLGLRLERGKFCDGTLGIGGAEGNVQVYTHRVVYSIGDNSLLLFLHYDLLIGTESQKMKVRLYARSGE